MENDDITGEVPDSESVPDIRKLAEEAIANRVIQPAGIIVKLDVCKDTGRLIAVPMLSDGLGGFGFRFGCARNDLG